MLARSRRVWSGARAAIRALVFYQLRRFWQSGRELIEQFVADLARQQEERERRAHFAEHNRRRFARRQAVEAELVRRRRLRPRRTRSLPQLQQQRTRLMRFWHYFKRRNLDRRMHRCACRAR